MQRRTDAQVRADVVAALRRAPVDELAIVIELHDGVVGLVGELATHSERLAAMTAAKDAAYPARVHSELTVAPLGHDYRLSDADIAIDVARAIAECSVAPGSIVFEVRNRVVTLRGSVGTAEQRARVRHLVREARGVDFIDNRITVDA